MAERDVGSIITRLKADATQMVATFQRARQQGEGFGKSLETIGRGFTRAAAITAGFGVAIGGVVKVTGDFEQSMANVGAVTGATGEGLQELSSIAVDMGRTTIFSASEAGEAMFALGSQGIKTADDFRNILKPSLDLAAAAQSDIGFVTETVIGNLRAFRLETSEAGRIANVFSAANENSALTAERLGNALRPVAPIAGSLGIEFEDVTAALGTLVNANFQAEEAGTAFRNVILKLLNPTKEAQKILAEKGLTLEQLQSQLRDPIQLIETLAAANLSEAEATKIFETRAAAAFFTLEKGVEDMRQFREEITGTDSATRIAERQLDTFNSQVRLLKSALEALIITIGTNLLPVFRQWVERITELTAKAIEYVENNREMVTLLISTAAKFLVITTAVLGFAHALGTILTIAPAIGTAIRVITLGHPWIALAAAIAFAVTKLLDFGIKAQDAKSAAAGLAATDAKLAENFGKTSEELKEVNGDFEKANRLLEERGVKLPFVIQSEEDLARAVRILSLAEEENMRKDTERTRKAKENADSRVATSYEEIQAKLQQQTEATQREVQENATKTQQLTEMDDLRKANFVDNMFGMTQAFSGLFESGIRGSETTAEAFENFAATIRDSFIKAISQMIARALVFFAIIRPLGGIFGFGRVGLGQFMGFAHGGMIPAAANGFMPAGEDMLVAARAGEAIITREAVRGLGGPAAINEINRTGGEGGGGGDTINVTYRSIRRPDQQDIDFIRTAVQQGRRQAAGSIG